MKTILSVLVGLFLALGSLPIQAETEPSRTLFLEEVCHPNGDCLPVNIEELAAVMRGAYGDGWWRTGQWFTAFAPDKVAPELTPVCRFYRADERFHFFAPLGTKAGYQCERIINTAGPQVFEGVVFQARLPDNINAPAWQNPCSENRHPIFTVTRGASGSYQSRLLTDWVEIERLEAAGWSVWPKPLFCAENSNFDPTERYSGRPPKVLAHVNQWAFEYTVVYPGQPVIQRLLIERVEVSVGQSEVCFFHSAQYYAGHASHVCRPATEWDFQSQKVQDGFSFEPVDAYHKAVCDRGGWCLLKNMCTVAPGTNQPAIAPCELPEDQYLVRGRYRS